MKSLFLGFFTLIIFAVQAQPVTGLKAYSQAFTPGMIRQRDIPGEQGGSSTRESLEKIQYYIYALMNPSSQVRFKTVWIRGKWFSVKGSTVQSTPVEAGRPKNTILVPATSQKVMQIETGDSLQKAPVLFPALKKMMKQSELMIGYEWKGKMYYRSLSKIVELEKIHGE